MIKILHIVEDYSFSSGGIRTVVKNLTEELSSLNYSSFILTSLKEKKDNNVYVVDSNKKPWLYSSDWKKKIQQICKEKKIDCIHIHGTWMFPQFIAAKFSVQNKIPFVLTPHGMFEPWLWQKGTLKKKAYFNFLTYKYFSKAAIVHAITNQEKLNLKKLLFNDNMIEIPNLIKVSRLDNEVAINKEKYLFYIGRLDQKKGIDILIKAFIKVNPRDVKLKIAGEFNSYKEELDKIVKDSSIKASNIEFLGFVKGKVKDDLIKNAIALVAPSHSEVIGMVNLEAAILKTPVITTHQTGLSKFWQDNGGFLINPNEQELTISIKKVLNWSKEKRKIEGEKLYDFVMKNYTWQNKLEDWRNLYKSIFNG